MVMQGDGNQDETTWELVEMDVTAEDLARIDFARRYLSRQECRIVSIDEVIEYLAILGVESDDLLGPRSRVRSKGGADDDDNA